MLCEKCETREATVHWTILLEPSTEESKHVFCSTCFPEIEAERLKGYNSLAGVPPPLTIDVERITAPQFMEAQAKAQRNGIDKPAFKGILKSLENLPKTRERLALEFLTLALQSLERGEIPPDLIGWASFGCSPESEIVPTYTMLLEKIILQYFELLGRSSSKPPAPRSSFQLTMAVLELRRVALQRFSTLFARLKREYGEGEDDPRRFLIAELEEKISRADRRVPRKHSKRS